MPNTPRTRKRNNLNRLNLCFSNLMQPFTPESSSTTPTTNSSSVDHNRPSSPVTDDDHTVILQNHFPNLEPEPEPEPEPADLATVFASQRFFFSSPGRSNSIFESTNTDADCTTSSSSESTTAAPPPHEPAGVDQSRLKGGVDCWSGSTVNEKEKVVLNGSVAVERYSRDPYADFRRSMQEMMEARPELMDVKSNWHLLHELLLCYLTLNPKNMHKFIFGAFADLVVSLISLSSSPQHNAGAGHVAAGGDGSSD